MELGIANKLILAFATLLIGIVVIGSIASNGLAVTETTRTVNETLDFSSSFLVGGNVNTTFPYTLAQAPSGWKAVDCPLTSVLVQNTSGATFTDDTDYVLDETTGVVTFKNTDAINCTYVSDNETYVSYNYCGDDYMNISWGRTMINLIAGFFAIAILMISVGLFYSVAKDYNII